MSFGLTDQLLSNKSNAYTGHCFLQSSATSISTTFPGDGMLLNESAGKNCGMSLIYKHWKAVVTVHVSTSKMHDFHILDSRAGQEVGERKKKSCISLLWGENHQQIITDVQNQMCFAPDAGFLRPSVQPAGKQCCASRCCFTPREATASPALPKSPLWLSFVITLTKPDSYRFLRLLTVSLLS